MRPRALIAAAVATVGLAAAPTAAAKPTAALPIDQNAWAVAYAPGRALVAEPDPFVHDLLVVRELRFSDRSNHVVAEIPVSDDTITRVDLAANATGYLMALHDDRERLILGSYDGPPRVLGDCSTDGAEAMVTAGTTGFAFTHAPCPGLPSSATIGPDGVLAPVVIAADAGTLAYAEPYLAAGGLEGVTVTDVTSGAQRLVSWRYVGVAGTIRLTADGTLAYATDEFDGLPNPGLYAWPPGAPTPTKLDERAKAQPLAEAGGRIVYGTAGTPRIVGMGGGPSRALTLPGAGLPTPLGFDGKQAAFTSFSCADERQVVIVDVDAPREPGAVSGCPVRFTRHTLRFDRAGRAGLSVVCRNGCHGFLDLREKCRSACATLAVARLDSPPSTRPRRVRLRLTDEGRARRGHRVATETDFSGVSLTSVGEIGSATL